MFQDKLKELRVENNYTQKELAEKLGCSRTAISGYEVGRNEPSFSDLNKIADFFNVTVDFLTGKSDIRKELSLTDLHFQLVKFVNGERIQLSEADFDANLDYSELYIDLGKSDKEGVVHLDKSDINEVVVFINNMFRKKRLTFAEVQDNEAEDKSRPS